MAHDPRFSGPIIEQIVMHEANQKALIFEQNAYFDRRMLETIIASKSEGEEVKITLYKDEEEQKGE